MALNAAGIEAHHWSLLGDRNAPDSTIFEFARRNGAVVLTADLDFGTLLAGTRSGKPSVIQLRLPKVSLEKALESTLRTLTRFGAEIEAGAIVSIDAATTRVRILPLR